MPKLKFKNGSTWTELNLGGGGISLDDFPADSIYIAPSASFGPDVPLNFPPSSGGGQALAVPNLYDIKSPASKIGGNWTQIYTNSFGQVDGISIPLTTSSSKYPVACGFWDAYNNSSSNLSTYYPASKFGYASTSSHMSSSLNFKLWMRVS